MSSNKRKRSHDEGQSQDGNLQKQKKRKSHGRKTTIDQDRKSSAAKSQEESNSSDGVPEADATKLEPEVQTVKGRKRGKRRSRKKGSSPALEDNEASTSIEAEVKMGDGVSIPDGEVAQVTPEEQGTRKQRKEKWRKDREERHAARIIQETTKADQEHNNHQDSAPNGAARVSDKTQILQSSQKEQAKGRIKSKPDRHSQHKSSRRKESRDETAPTWRVSESTGGCMLRIDPLFSPSEE